jgi:metal-responsive CopG/Arc/MetJ family transcriptional regulator
VRITVHIPDKLAEEIKTYAGNEKTSVSSLTADALAYYLTEKRKKALGLKVLELAGKGCVTEDADAALEEGRQDHEHRY